MSDTPRTDAVKFTIFLGKDNCGQPHAAEVVTADHAVRLERELNESKSAICIGPPLISILAKDGQWAGSDGHGLVAADGLFQQDPYEKILQLERELNESRALIESHEQELSSIYATSASEALAEANTANVKLLELMGRAHAREAQLVGAIMHTLAHHNLDGEGCLDVLRDATATSAPPVVPVEDVKLLVEALTRIKEATDAPDIDVGGEMQFGLHCGVEDHSCQDRYEGADYGWSQGVERTLEWSHNESNHALSTFTAKHKI